MNGKYNVRSELLARCIGTGRLKGDVVSDFIGFNGSKQIGYVLLTLFLIKVINLICSLIIVYLIVFAL